MPLPIKKTQANLLTHILAEVEVPLRHVATGGLPRHQAQRRVALQFAVGADQVPPTLRLPGLIVRTLGVPLQQQGPDGVVHSQGAEAAVLNYHTTCDVPLYTQRVASARAYLPTYLAIRAYPVSKCVHAEAT